MAATSSVHGIGVFAGSSWSRECDVLGVGTGGAAGGLMVTLNPTNAYGPWNSSIDVLLRGAACGQGSGTAQVKIFLSRVIDPTEVCSGSGTWTGQKGKLFSIAASGSCHQEGPTGPPQSAKVNATLLLLNKPLRYVSEPTVGFWTVS